jgi:hypothetical protein
MKVIQLEALKVPQLVQLQQLAVLTKRVSSQMFKVKMNQRKIRKRRIKRKRIRDSQISWRITMKHLLLIKRTNKLRLIKMSQIKKKKNHKSQRSRKLFR